MKKLLATAITTALISLPALAALKVGDMAPMFSAPASMDGKEFTYSLEKSVAEGPTVVYFFPSAFTNGCNIQAHTFAVNMDKFREAGASVVGVSLDSIARLNDFSADPDYCAGQLPMVSDGDGSIARSFELSVREAREGMQDTRGVEIDHGFAERTTFIVDTHGKIVASVGEVSPEENVLMSLEIIEGLAD